MARRFGFGRKGSSAKTAERPVEEDTKTEAKSSPISVEPELGDSVDLRSVNEIPDKEPLMDRPAMGDFNEKVSTDDLGTGHGAASDGDSSFADVGETVYDTVDIKSDKELVSQEAEEMLNADAPVGGLDGRNDAAGYGGGGAKTPTEGVPDFDDATASAGDDTTGGIGAILTKIVNDPNLSTEEKDAKIEIVRQEVAAANDDNIGVGHEPVAGSADAGTLGDPAEDGDSPGIVDSISQKVYGRDFMGEAPKNSGLGLVGGASEGATDGIDANIGKADQKVVEEAAKAEIAKAEGTKSDVGEEGGLDGPKMWDDFSDEYKDGQTEAILGADIDYGDQVNGGVVQFTEVDGNIYTGEYSEDYSDPTAGQVASATQHLIDEAGPEDEFFEA